MLQQQNNRLGASSAHLLGPRAFGGRHTGLMEWVMVTPLALRYEWGVGLGVS